MRQEDKEKKEIKPEDSPSSQTPQIQLRHTQVLKKKIIRKNQSITKIVINRKDNKKNKNMKTKIQKNKLVSPNSSSQSNAKYVCSPC